MSHAIEVDNLIKKYKKSENNAVDGITFSVEEGNFFAFLGPNGAGKTTTISVLTTTLAKTSGKVTIAGYNIDKQQKEVRNSIGVIFQKPSLDENLTAEENIRLHAILYGIVSFNPSYALMNDEYKRRVNQLAEVLGIEKEIFRPIKTFSGGMKRKLEIIRTLMHNPKILFLDEPTSGLDPASRNNLWSYLQDVRRKENTTIFLTTHYLEEAEGADKLCIINKGRIVAEGTPLQVKETLIEEYLSAEVLPDDKSKLENEMKSLNLVYEFTGNIVKIDLENQSAQKIIKEIDTRLTNIKIERPTLDEAYIKIIEQDNS